MANANVYNLPEDAAARDMLRLLASYLLGLSEERSDESPPTWFVPVRWEPLDINPITEVDPFVSSVFKCLEDRFGVTGHRNLGMTFEKMPLKSMAIYSATEAAFDSKFGLVNYEDSLYGFICGRDGVPDDANLRPWVEALAYAEQERSKGHLLHEWSAAIGPIGAPNGRSLSIASDRVVIGELALERCGFSYEERRPHSSLGSWSTVRWEPVVITGRSPGHNWRAAELVALRQVYRLCALLSLETACHWTLKESPRPVEWGPLHFPDVTPLGLLKREITSEDMASQSASTLPVDFARLSRMWTRCAEEACLCPPVEAYYQAGSLRESHPSFALVGFVGAIEEAGKLLVEVGKPEPCSACGKDTTNSSAKRFRDALRLVLPEDKIRAVSGALYKWRSGTAHAGRTHSWESSFGHPEMSDSMLVARPEFMFDVRGLSHADELARALLLILLNGQSPH